MNTTTRHPRAVPNEPSNETRRDEHENNPLTPSQKKIAIFAGAVTLVAVGWVGYDSRSESSVHTSPVQENEIVQVVDESFTKTGIFDDDGEGGTSVWVDTLSEEYPELTIMKAGEDVYGNPVEQFDYFATKENLANAFGVSADAQGEKIQTVMGGNPNRWAKVEIKYDAESGFSYERAG